MTETEKKSRVLIVEDDGAQADAVEQVLKRVGHECVVVTAPRRALDIIKKGGFDLVITDLVMEGVDGMEILRASKREMPWVEVIMITGHGSIDTAVEAMRQGAHDYISKPLDMEELRHRVARALEHRHLVQRARHLAAQLDERFGFEGIIGNSPQIKRVIDTARLIAPTSAIVLIQGDSGTGKELLARAIHNNSPRKNKHFVALNCAALSEGILESELFGHEKGAFTGALSARIGRFEYADGGTLFLDEVGDMPAATQIKLLRVLEDGQIMRVGSNEPLQVDVRLISATHANLEMLIEERRFREDLYFRLKGVTLTLPPLRMRRGDIPLLTTHFLKMLAEQHGKKVAGITPEAKQILVNFSWPGNVRQLRNTIETMVVLSLADMLDVGDIPEDILQTGGAHVGRIGSLAGMSLEEAEKELIRSTLAVADGNREEAARMLDIAQRTLYRKLKQYGLG
ncbi:MAG: sigma-54 dependent transcriptional regulator [Planctomycetia bacterium]|nr:sigma-54 dependent transcriptional regulator [Planctomycetia bacterium]